MTQPSVANRSAGTQPVRHHVVLAHPAAESFCRSIADAYIAAADACGQATHLHDLYSIGFDPVLTDQERPGPRYRPRDDLAAELAMIREADVLVLVYPIWFGLPPAMMKGYVDRVLGADFAASNLRDHRPSPLLGGKRLVVITTSATTRPWLEEQGQYSALRQAFDLYLNDIFGLHGHDRLHFDAIVPGIPAHYAGECLETTRQRTRMICAEELSARHAAQKATLSIRS
ncbi:NAD(P)H-dependent oxidoreductase [Sphingomonas echinoides]|jgi:NAD(P)H dehydrogenase (quinone)|uniref:NAD(P)H-dependent oxidoreductase n=1 Tax=Sphingomonas echinoides TaxID=59803 RepID=A0ABU4PQZ5_9SPHN|nr:NAD(P)H-dependent oxidoreductase [Sphingomonas echinoides]MDX5986566.1 NAD(P)H-dependent oxidoreductase [Sphingomonas echinoides]